ncbi:MAG: amino acid permease [Planctomycetota bacterium]|nr:MAG: amino acid permease [Planctomycetota bacterium]
MNERTGETEKRRAFGTFGGVFTPSILTILGVIMFMRAGFVVGNAGLLFAVAILVIAKGITFTTALSLSAIGTNMQVRGGGAYYLISRVLGPEFGGAIGIALYLALALSVPFYVLGFAEALLLSFPGLEPYFLPLCLGTAAAMLGISAIGADWAIKTQYGIMAILAVAIVAFLGGAAAQFSGETFAANLGPEYSQQPSGKPYSFWLIFAIYFPAVTGIDAGVNMSGDLRDPARSLPRGTLAAVGVGFAIYLLQALLLSGAFPRDELIANPYGVLKDNALFGAGFLVAGGVYAATLSSALGSCLGAPRVLQAVSRDPVLSFLAPFAKGAPGTDEPRRALALTAVIAVGVLVWASFSGGSGGAALNVVAAIITMFFLYTYGMMNLAAFIEAFGENPSFRPRFRYFHWSLALLGALGCVAAAFLIDPLPALVAVLLIAGLLLYLRARHLQSTYADARRGFVFANLRKNLLRLAAMPEDPRNWRPCMLVLSGNPSSRERLVSYGVWLEAGRGIVILASVVVGPLLERIGHRAQALRQLEEFCRERSLQALPMVVVHREIGEGIATTLQTAGLGPLRPNLVLFGWSSATGRLTNLGLYLRTSAALGMNLLVLKEGARPFAQEQVASEHDVPERRIDVWWRGRQNGSLMLLLAHLLTRNWEWSRSRVRVLRVVDDPAGQAPAQQALQELIDAGRVEATACVLVRSAPFGEVLRETSNDADAIFLGFQVPAEADDIPWNRAFETLLDGLAPSTILVHAVETDDLLVT